MAFGVTFKFPASMYSVVLDKIPPESFMSSMGEFCNCGSMFCCDKNSIINHAHQPMFPEELFSSRSWWSGIGGDSTEDISGKKLQSNNLIKK